MLLDKHLWFILERGENSCFAPFFHQNLNMKNIILSNTIFFFSFFSFLNAQSNIGLTIGLDFTQMKAEELSLPIFLLEKGFRNRSLSFGLRFEQKISKSYFLSIQGDYSKKYTAAFDAGIVPYEEIAFSKYRTSLAFNWSSFPLLSIGVGPSGTYIPKIALLYFGNVQDETDHHRKEIGALLSVGCFFRGFMLEANYYHGIKNFGRYNLLLQPLNSINLSLHYLFKLGHKKQDGPKNKSRF